jgi:FixJ family two-component response regulator
MHHGLLIAVVDDDESSRETTKDLLESAGFSAETFSCPSALLNCGRLPRVACLITDLSMQEMTGLELHLHLVAAKYVIPTIIVTAYPNERVRSQAFEANVLAFLTKPFAAEELLVCVHCAMCAGDPK